MYRSLLVGTLAVVAVVGCVKTQPTATPEPAPQPAVPPAAPTAAGASSAGAVFEQRLLPIFKSPNPSSCV